MRALVSGWLNSRKEHLSVFEGNDEIGLKRQGDFILLEAQLVAARCDNAVLQRWMRLGAASLAHYQGALAQKPDSGALWLMQGLRSNQDELYVLGCLEALLNQRDTWRAVVARLEAPAHNFKPTSLRSLSY